MKTKLKIKLNDLVPVLHIWTKFLLNLQIIVFNIKPGKSILNEIILITKLNRILLNLYKFYDSNFFNLGLN